MDTIVKLDEQAEEVVREVVGGGSNIYLCNYLEETTSAELTSEQVAEFVKNLTDPNKQVRFTTIGGDWYNVNVISYTKEVDSDTGDVTGYYCWGFFSNYYYSVSLNLVTGVMETEMP